MIKKCLFVTFFILPDYTFIDWKIVNQKKKRRKTPLES